MSNFYLAEYKEMKRDGNGNLAQIPLEPPIAKQKISFTGTHGISVAFNDETNYVRLVTDADAHYSFGQSPVATVAFLPVTSGTHYFFGVRKNDKVSVIAQA